MKELTEKCAHLKGVKWQHAQGPSKGPEVYTHQLQPIDSISLDIFTYSIDCHLIVVDGASSFIFVKLLGNKKTSMEVTIRTLHLCKFFRFTTQIYFDKGPHFQGPWEEFLQKILVEWIPSSAYNPESNRLTECGVGITQNLLKSASKEEMT